MTLDEKIAICKLYAWTILIDLELTPEETGALGRLMDAYGLTPEQRREALKVRPGDDPAELVACIRDRSARSALIQELANAVRADGKVDPRERALFVRVLEAFGLGEAAATAMLG